MTTKHVEIFVEEPSMEVFLRGLLPRLLEGISFQVYPFSCKDELLQRLPQRLRGYRSWLPADWRLLVLVDRDQDDCQSLKAELERMAAEAGLTSRSVDRKSFEVVHRIVIEELEAWYFGDWSAVRQAYPKVSKTVPEQRSYRDPDAIAGGTWETFERILGRVGYFRTGLRKTEAARQISPFVDPRRQTSQSFRQFYEVIREISNPIGG